MKRYKNHPLSMALFLLVNLAAVITAAVVLFLIGYILWHGVPNLSLPGIFAWEYNGENQSMTPGDYQHFDYDSAYFAFGSANRCICGNLSRGICEKGQ